MNLFMPSGVAAALIIGMAATFAESNNSREAEVKRLAKPLVDGRLVPGLAIGIYDDGHVETFGLGVLSKERPETPDAHTIYEIGSVTKVFTALLLAEAVKRGEVTLDTPLSRLLPPDVKPPKGDGAEITLEQLATHSSGLPRIPSNMTADSLVNPYADYSREKLFAFLNGYHLSHKPGAEWAYSNLGMGLLGTLLADKAGVSYGNLLQDRIAKPLGMADTTVSLNSKQQLRLAPPHRGGLGVSNWDFAALAGCGAVRSTVSDLLKLIAAEVDPSSSPLKASIQLVSQRRRTVPGVPWTMALGWMIAGDGTTLWHDGQTGGYSSSVFVNPGLKKGVVVLANGADSAVDVLGERLIQSLAGMKVQPPKVRSSIPLTETQLDRLAGDYLSSVGFTITIQRSGDALFAQLTGQPALHIHAESATRFFYRDVEADLQFEIDPKTDRATALTLYQNGKQIRCPRKK
jgi:CubicO group peptidase (beta-lactamase class C family)